MDDLTVSVVVPRVTLLDLPDDVLLIIFSYITSDDLCSLSRTCSRLQRVTSDRSLWININFLVKPSLAPFLLLYDNLSFIDSHTRSITLRGRKEKSQSSPNVSYEDGLSSSSDEEDLVEIKFDFENESVNSEKADSQSLEVDGVNRRSLEEFPQMLESFENNIDKKWLRLHFLSVISTRCPELKSLNLQYIRLFYQVPPIIPEWKSLTELSLRGSHLRSKTICNFGPLYNLSVKLPNLVCLDIGCCTWVESHCFMAISKFNHLRILLLDGCFNLGSCVAYTSLAACLGFRSIQVLDLRDTQFSDSDLLSFRRNPTITKLILGRRIEPLDANGKKSGASCANAEPGGSGNNKATSGCPYSSRQGLKRRHPNDVHQHRSKRQRRSAIPQEALVIHVNLGLGYRVPNYHEDPDLEISLNEDLSIGNSVTDEGIVSLGIDGLPALTDLVLAGSGSVVTNRSLKALQGRVGLRSLDVRRTGVTLAGVTLFLEKCPNVLVYSDFNDKNVDITDI